ncbi:MAG: hypothetical protein QG628_599 [Patescibacteria group bacterium]|nr:hypothetical protein [Patescibacteria group bacterium]
MSVLTDLSISYESLPGEPSFFVTAQQATPVRHEIPQSSLSIPYISESPKVRNVASNFDISPSFSTRHAIKRHATNHIKKSSSTIVGNPLQASKIVEEVKQSSIVKAVTPSRSAPTASRGMFNEFERASLLSYMQRRQYS